MNRRPSGSLFLSRAIAGFLQYKSAEGLSPNTLRSYSDHLKLWLEYTGDITIKQLDAKVVQNYFVWLRTEYQSRQIAGRPKPLAPKTIRNFYITLSAFFTWASRVGDLVRRPAARVGRARSLVSSRPRAHHHRGQLSR